MTAHLKLDEEGRLLIPRELREALGLQAGETVHADLENGSLVLTPVPAPAELIEYQGRLVVKTAHPVTGDPVEEFRAERLRELGGQ